MKNNSGVPGIPPFGGLGGPHTLLPNASLSYCSFA